MLYAAAKRVYRYGWAALAGLTRRFWPAALVTRRMPMPFRRRIVGALGARPLARSESTQECWGIQAKLSLDDDVQRQIFFGLFEQEELALVNTLVEPGDICLDVGANMGFYSCHLGRLVGPAGRVYAFEPEPRNTERLDANLRLSGVHDRVVIEPLAVCNEVGNTRFYRSEAEHSGWGSIHEYPEFHHDAIDVATTSVDAFMKERSIEDVGLMKVDVEGADLEVYKGAEESLARGAFRYVMAEWNGVWFPKRGVTVESFLDRFCRFGYRPVPWPGSQAAALVEGRIDADGAIVNLVLGRGCLPLFE